MNTNIVKFHPQRSGTWCKLLELCHYARLPYACLPIKYGYKKQPFVVIDAGKGR